MTWKTVACVVVWYILLSAFLTCAVLTWLYHTSECSSSWYVVDECWWVAWVFPCNSMLLHWAPHGMILGAHQRWLSWWTRTVHMDLHQGAGVQGQLLPHSTSMHFDALCIKVSFWCSVWHMSHIWSSWTRPSKNIAKSQPLLWPGSRVIPRPVDQGVSLSICEITWRS